MEENKENKQEITIISQVELEAVSRLTEGIRNDLKNAAQSLMRACAKIAEVRDRKLYKALGCKNFEEYCENKLNITYMQGFKYATIGKEFGQNLKSTLGFENIKSVSGFGKTTNRFLKAEELENRKTTIHFSPELLQNLNVEKLYLMAKTSEDIREEVAKAVDINDITVKELKSKISELERQYRDISDKLEKTEKNISEQVKTVEKNVGEIVRETIKSQPAPPENPAPENAPAKPSFILYSDYISFIEEFSDEEAGELFKAIMLYVNNRPVPKLSKGVKAIYKHITNQLEKDFDKWQDIKEKRREAVKKRWEGKDKNDDSEKYNCIVCNTNDTVNVNDNVNVNENVNVNIDVINQSIDRSAYAERKNKKVENVENYESEFEAYKEVVMDNISASNDEEENIAEIMTRAICSTKPTETICKSTYPREVIKSAMLKVDENVVAAVLDEMKKVSTIRNYEKYLVSALFNEVNNKHFKKNAEQRNIDYLIDRDFGKN